MLLFGGGCFFGVHLLIFFFFAFLSVLILILIALSILLVFTSFPIVLFIFIPFLFDFACKSQNCDKEKEIREGQTTSVPSSGSSSSE